MVKVYTRTNCPQCVFTKKRMIDKGIDYIEENIDTNEAAFNELSELGIRAVPYVVTEQKSWTGFRPDMIDGITA